MNQCSSQKDVLNYLESRYQAMPEFLQAAEEIIQDITEFINSKKNKKPYWNAVRYLVQPDRVITFKVPWKDDDGNTQINSGYRVQFNNLLGPFKGGLRFVGDLNLSVLHFLGLEQTFKNSLIGLPMGGAKGGADFSPRDKTEHEIQRFCQSFMTQLARHIGDDLDIPAGDIGVSSREIGIMFDQYKRITGRHSTVLTGKDELMGGSSFREEATGYGCVYFADAALKEKQESLEGKRCLISGSGNVALHCAEKLLELKATVLTVSGRDGTLLCKDGLNNETINLLKERKQKKMSLNEIAEKQGLEFIEGRKPWHIENAELAFPCATENELDKDDAKALSKNGCTAIFEGANMPCTKDALSLFEKQRILVGPSKAANAGGVAVSGFEISQNITRRSWEGDTVDQKLKDIMNLIFEDCKKYGGNDKGYINYRKGSNIAAFVNLYRAFAAYGI